jgi:hypothetical protein
VDRKYVDQKEKEREDNEDNKGQNELMNRELLV